MKILCDDKGIFNITLVIFTIVVSSALIGFFSFNQPLLLYINFKWFQTSAFFMVALIAQTFFKLNDAREVTKVTTSELNRIHNDISRRTKILFRVLIFYVVSAILLTMVHSSIEPIVSKVLNTPNYKVDNLTIYFIKSTYIISLGFVTSWIFSIYNAYTIYEDISELKGQISYIQADNEDRKKALERLMGK